MKRIPDSVGERFITEDGRVFSNGKELKTQWCKGYEKVRVKFTFGWKFWFVHRLVLLTYVGPCPEGMEACHNDGDKSNNHVSNLRWDTRKNNHKDKKLHGTHQSGEYNPASVLDWDKVDQIRSRYSAGGVSQRQLAREYNVFQPTIWNIVNNKQWIKETKT